MGVSLATQSLKFFLCNRRAFHMNAPISLVLAVRRIDDHSPSLTLRAFCGAVRGSPTFRLPRCRLQSLQQRDSPALTCHDDRRFWILAPRVPVHAEAISAVAEVYGVRDSPLSTYGHLDEMCE